MMHYEVFRFNLYIKILDGVAFCIAIVLVQRFSVFRKELAMLSVVFMHDGYKKLKMKNAFSQVVKNIKRQK